MCVILFHLWLPLFSSQNNATNVHAFTLHTVLPPITLHRNKFVMGTDGYNHGHSQHWSQMIPMIQSNRKYGINRFLKIIECTLRAFLLSIKIIEWFPNLAQNRVSLERWATWFSDIYTRDISTCKSFLLFAVGIVGHQSDAVWLWVHPEAKRTNSM
jgi:hypothetical protein